MGSDLFRYTVIVMTVSLHWYHFSCLTEFVGWKPHIHKYTHTPLSQVIRIVGNMIVIRYESAQDCSLAPTESKESSFAFWVCATAVSQACNFKLIRRLLFVCSNEQSKLRKCRMVHTTVPYKHTVWSYILQANTVHRFSHDICDQLQPVFIRFVHSQNWTLGLLSGAKACSGLLHVRLLLTTHGEVPLVCVGAYAFLNICEDSL